MPPPRSSGGADASTAFTTNGSLEKVVASAPKGPIPGTENQTIIHGRKPRTTKTAKISPQIRNHRRARCFMPDNTAALMIALSMLEMDSKMVRPRIVNATPTTDTGISVAFPNVERHQLDYQLFESAPPDITLFAIGRGNRDSLAAFFCERFNDRRDEQDKAKRAGSSL